MVCVCQQSAFSRYPPLHDAEVASQARAVWRLRPEYDLRQGAARAPSARGRLSRKPTGLRSSSGPHPVLTEPRARHVDAMPRVAHQVVLLDQEAVSIIEHADRVALGARRQRPLEGPPDRASPFARGAQQSCESPRIRRHLAYLGCWGMV